MTLRLDDDSELQVAFLEITEISGAEAVSERDIVVIERGYYEHSSGFHPIFFIEVK